MVKLFVARAEDWSFDFSGPASDIDMQRFKILEFASATLIIFTLYV